MNTTELWDEIYNLRRRMIARYECPHCAGLLSENIVIDGLSGYYRCYECNRTWVYYGALISQPED